MNRKPKFSLAGIALIMVLGSGLFSKLLQGCVESMPAGNFLRKLALFSTDIFRLIGLIGLLLLFYATLRGIGRLVKRLFQKK